MKRRNNIIVFIFLLVLLSCSTGEKIEMENKSGADAIGLNGKELFSPDPSESLLEKLEARKENFQNDSTDVMNLIWYGRFLAYAGKYDDALSLYERGKLKFPDDPRIYRHRGHRLISVRRLDEAIDDLEKAAELIVGTENASEPDGMPNAMNIPVSTTHGNIYYHLGLAYYLKHDFENALTAYQKCLETGSLSDNVVSATHWLFMILNRLGRAEEAKMVLKPIEKEMEVIENHAYHKLCLFYKGEIDEVELLGGEDSDSANDAVLYGLGNYYYYNNDLIRAKEIYSEILSRDSWSSFGYIAAESDLAQME